MSVGHSFCFASRVVRRRELRARRLSVWRSAPSMRAVLTLSSPCPR